MQNYISLLLSLLILFSKVSAADCLKDIYVFDIGSGGIDSVGYTIDSCKKEVKKVIPQTYYHLPLQHCISTSVDKKSLTSECINDAKTAFMSLQKNFGITCKEADCIAVATAWARNAKNSKDLINKLQQEGVKVSVLSQHDEGKISFHSLMLENKVPSQDEKNSIVFDIGGGSFQLNTLDDNGEIHVYKGPYGMFNFKQLVLKRFGNGNGDMLQLKDLDAIKKFALLEIGHELRKDKLIKEKLSHKNAKIFGAGAFMSKATAQLNLEKVFSIEDVERILDSIVGKTVPEIQEIYKKLPKEYAPNQQFSLLIIYAVMKECGFDKVYISSRGSINEYIALNGFAS